MTRIKIEVPNNDETALFCMGKSLVDMAASLAGVEFIIIEKDEYELLTRLHATTETLQQSSTNMMDEPEAMSTNSSHDDSVPFPEVDTAAQQVESLGATHIITEQKLVGNPEPVDDGNFSQGYIATVEQIADPVDSTGTPWDERIHSTSKALNADGTWRLRRKPKDMDEAAWAAFVETVKVELNGATVDDPESVAGFGEGVKDFITGEELCIDEGCDHHGTPHICVTPEPPVTPPGDDFHTDADVVTEQTVVGIPPLPVPPPVVVAPPVPEVTTWDFPRLMTFLTERHGKIDVATVNTLLAQDGMSSVQELNAHPDKIGPFVARVKAHLGE